MAKRAAAASTESVEVDIPKEATKLRKLIIKNFGCIGNSPVEIDLDDIVVLVGSNNTGKSTILRAYHLLFSSPTPKLAIEDFPEGKVDLNNLPEIHLHTQVVRNIPGTKWIGQVDGQDVIREKWTWDSPNVAAKRRGYDVIADDWSDNVPWGAPNVANSRRPKPHRIEAFASPDDQAKAVIKLLMTTLESAATGMSKTEIGEDGESKLTKYGELLEGIAGMRKAVLEQTQDRIEAAETHLTELVQAVFKGYRVEFDAKTEDDVESCLNFFKPGAVLRMGPENGHLSTVEKQGSGARRTLLWAALKFAAEHNDGAAEQSNILLMDEPELCLHPNAIREACRVLYELPTTGKWQVMVTTHSPCFIDLSRDNTTVVRVDRSADGGNIKGTTVFRPDRVKLSDDEKTELKLLNLCDPHLCEFFFGGRTIIVEGDTEYAAFKYIVEKYHEDEEFRDIHVVRARGKATICLVARILNQFNSRFAVLHDSDSPKALRKVKGKQQEIVNPAWTNNSRILDEVKAGLESARVRLIALVPHFEGAFMGEEITSEKPAHSWSRLSESNDLCEKVKALILALLKFDVAVPPECTEWSEIPHLEKRYTEFVQRINAS